MNPHPRTLEDIITDFKGRRSAIIKALTKDFQHFNQLCNPNLQSLCLYAFPDQQWKVDLLPPNWDLPEPKLGINLVRDSMNKHEWLSMVASHSNAWLHSVASYFASKLKLDKSGWKRLFNKITDFCSVWEAITGETRKRKRKDFLPEELLVEVLSTVPVRDLVKYRSVCKRWRSLIDDPVFVSTHLRNYKSNREGSHLLVIVQRRNRLKYEQVMVRRSDTFRKVMVLNNGVNEGGEVCFYYNVGYINGVMLIMKDRDRGLDDFMLWNPSINRSLNISNSASQDMREAKFIDLGLGFDAVSNDLKVVAIVYPHAESSHSYGDHYRAIIPGFVQIYALSTKSWGRKLAVCPPPYWTYGPQAIVNGCIHWMNLGPEIRHGDSWHEMRNSHIVSFDVSNEVFSYFELPSEVVEDRDGERVLEELLIVLEGSLGMCYNCGTHHNVWVMEEYGVPNSWSKRYKFELQIDNLFNFQSNALAFQYISASLKEEVGGIIGVCFIMVQIMMYMVVISGILVEMVATIDTALYFSQLRIFVFFN